jgi:hypothetical protein
MTPEERKVKQREWTKRSREKHKERYQEKLRLKRSTPEYKQKVREIRQRWYAKNFQKERDRVKAYRALPENKIKLYSTRLKRNRGLTYEEREKEIEKQGGGCAICESHIKHPHIDHCHKTNKRRGVLCSACNHGLGHFRDDIVRMKKAIKYLEKYMAEEKQGLSAEDKLAIRTLEVEAYRIQATQQQVNEQMKAAVESLNAGIRAVAEKLGYDQKEYRLDLKTMEFVRVGSGDVTAQ